MSVRLSLVGNPILIRPSLVDRIQVALIKEDEENNVVSGKTIMGPEKFFDFGVTRAGVFR